MLPGMPGQGQLNLKKEERELVKLFRELSEKDQHTLRQFASFLGSDSNSEAAEEVTIVEEIAEPLDIPRPDDESVIKAIKRLSKTYPMVNKDTMLNETSSLMTAHLIQGKEAQEVIDELEVLFKSAYDNLRAGVEK